MGGTWVTVSATPDGVLATSSTFDDPVSPSPTRFVSKLRADGTASWSLAFFPGRNDFSLAAGKTQFVVASTVDDGATIDFDHSPTGGQLTIRAPGLRGSPPAEDASVVERVRYVIETEINPQLASHNGRVSLREVTAEGVVVLQFGGGCHGCGMVDATLRGGVEKTLMERVPGVTGVADATDHSTGENPYVKRRTASGT